MLGNATDAEDAVQDDLLAACEHVAQFKGQSEMSTWVKAIVHNCARQQLQKRGRHVEVPLDEPMGEIQTLSVCEQLADPRPDPDDECQGSELSTRLTDFYTQLSPTLRTTFRLRDMRASTGETAQILQIPCGTVNVQSSRARKKLKKVMQGALRPQSRNLALCHRTNREQIAKDGYPLDSPNRNVSYRSLTSSRNLLGCGE